MAVVDIAEQTFIYLIGKTGTGKSSTGNTILGTKRFTASASSTASTMEIQVEKTQVGSWTVSVVDGPGLVGGLDKSLTHQAMVKFKHVHNTHPSCGHIFLIVCRYGERFTSEDNEIVRALRAGFGRDVFKDHGIVVVTCGGNFEADYEGEGKTFESWCDEQGGDFGKLVASCGHRALLVENSSGTEQGHQFRSRLHDFMSAVKFGFCRPRTCPEVLVHTVKNPSIENAIVLSQESAKLSWVVALYIIKTVYQCARGCVQCCFHSILDAANYCLDLLPFSLKQNKPLSEIHRS